MHTQNQIPIHPTDDDRYMQPHSNRYMQPHSTRHSTDDDRYMQPHSTRHSTDDDRYMQPHSTRYSTDDDRYRQHHSTRHSTDDDRYKQHHSTRHSTDDDRLRQHHSTRYYARRVRDSLTTRVSKIICAIFLTLLFIIGLIFFILWLSLRPHRPRFHTRDFSVPGLAQTNGFQNAEVIFNITARNSNQMIGVHYDAMQVTLFYNDQSIGKTTLLFPFYQEPKNTTVLYGVLSGATLTLNNNRWMQFQNDRSQGVVVFRLEVTATIRFKVFNWNTRHHMMHANCGVGVGPDGSILASYKDKKCPVYFT